MAKDLFPRVPSGDILPCEDAVVSTEKLRERLMQEGIEETVVKDCETIMLSEVSNLQNRLKVLSQKHVILLDTLRQLEVCFGSSLCIAHIFGIDLSYMFLAAIGLLWLSFEQSLLFHIVK